jgi:hypothetical protein
MLYSECWSYAQLSAVSVTANPKHIVGCLLLSNVQFMTWRHHPSTTTYLFIDPKRSTAALLNQTCSAAATALDSQPAVEQWKLTRSALRNCYKCAIIGNEKRCASPFLCSSWIGRASRDLIAPSARPMSGFGSKQSSSAEPLDKSMERVLSQV